MKSDLLKYSGRWIIEKFPGLYVPYSCIKGLQPTEKTPIWKEKTSCWKYGLKFNNVMSPAVQIHHNGKFHWVTSVKLDGQIYVLDSMSNGKITPSLQIQLYSLFVRHWLQFNNCTSSVNSTTNKQHWLWVICHRKRLKLSNSATVIWRSLLTATSHTLPWDAPIHSFP